MNNELDRDVEVSTFKNQINHNGFSLKKWGSELFTVNRPNVQ